MDLILTAVLPAIEDKGLRLAEALLGSLLRMSLTSLLSDSGDEVLEEGSLATGRVLES